MPIFITNQNKLAEAVGVTAQYLSSVKKTCRASNDLLANLVKVTGIEASYWELPKKSSALNKRLRIFLSNQKKKELEVNN